MKVNEIFYSMQGEGTMIGRPAVFVRLQGCNLNCKWCDTKYTWGKGGKEIAAEKVAERVKKVCKSLRYNNESLVVITGGEPLLQMHSVEVLVKTLKESGKNWGVEIETNGTINPSEYLRTECVFNISPKLKNSGNPKHNFAIGGRIPSATFKFVVSDMNDVKEVEKFVKAKKIPKDIVMLMPEGVKESANKKHLLNIVSYALNKGFRITPRLQISLYGNRRGV